MKNNVNVPSKSTLQAEKFVKVIFFAGILKANDENSRIRIQDPDPLVRGMDLRIRIHTKMSWIRNTAFDDRSLQLHSPSRSRSASSMTRYLTRSSLKERLFSSWSASRPGVATTTWGRPRDRSSACAEEAGYYGAAHLVLKDLHCNVLEPETRSQTKNLIFFFYVSIIWQLYATI